MPADGSNTKAFIKARLPGEKRWRFVGGGGRLTNLRVHAIRWVSMEVAERYAVDIARKNPGIETKAVLGGDDAR